MLATFQGESDGQTNVGLENMMASMFGNITGSFKTLSRNVANNTKKFMSSAGSQYDMSTLRKQAVKRLNETQTKLREMQQKAMNAARSGAKQLQSSFSSVSGNGKATASVSVLNRNGTVFTRTVSTP
ncbi:hypothetical protein B566_EDAN016536 [Ephemera danica]|nr:hypothetical protein B566_EDAN016536 [Ephemera danica]